MTYRYGVLRPNDDGSATVRITIPGDTGWLQLSADHPVSHECAAGEKTWYRRLIQAGSEIEGPIDLSDVPEEDVPEFFRTIERE